MNSKIKLLSRSILIGAVAVGSMALAQSGSGTATKMRDNSEPYVGNTDKSHGTSEGTTYNNGRGSTGTGAGANGAQSAQGLQDPAVGGSGTAGTADGHARDDAAAKTTQPKSATTPTGP